MVERWSLNGVVATAHLELPPNEHTKFPRLQRLRLEHSSQRRLRLEAKSIQLTPLQIWNAFEKDKIERGQVEFDEADLVEQFGRMKTWMGHMGRRDDEQRRPCCSGVHGEE